MLIAQTVGTTVVSTAKQITIQNNNPANTVMYTVPPGRKFVGRIFNTQTNQQTFINNAWIYAYMNGGSSQFPAAPAYGDFTLIAGTVVKEGGTGSSSLIIGVETDL